MKSGRLATIGLFVFNFLLPCFSKDWLFVTTGWGGGPAQVLLIEPDTGNVRTLWSGGAELDAIVSPDAKRLYVTFNSDSGGRLAIVDTVTGAVLRLLETPPIIRWIIPSTSGMAISSDGRWLYLLKHNNPAGPNEFSLMTFDTEENRFVPEESAITDCPRLRIVAIPGMGKVRVLCDGGNAETDGDGELVVRLKGFQHFALA